MMQKKNVHFRDGDDRYEIDGETDHMGIELGLNWALRDDLELQTSFTYAQHEYAYDREVGQIMRGSNPLETIEDGNTIDGAPKTLGHTTLSYKAGERVSTALIWEHVGSYYMDASNTTKYDGHDIFALNIDYTLSGDTSLALRIDNLFDEAYATRADKWFGDDRYFPGEERRFMARLSRQF
jgi:outer membrane receptor protein involved in Fe transport